MFCLQVPKKEYNHGGTFGSFMRSGKQIVLSAQGHRTDRVFYQVVVDLIFTVFGVTTNKMKPSIIFLAASRYERYQDFRDFCISNKGKKIKATDLLSRIDISIDIPQLTANDRILILNRLTNGKATPNLKALCYLADLEEGARRLKSYSKV